jgi:hypothetical protein
MNVQYLLIICAKEVKKDIDNERTMDNSSFTHRKSVFNMKHVLFFSTTVIQIIFCPSKYLVSYAQSMWRNGYKSKCKGGR